MIHNKSKNNLFPLEPIGSLHRNSSNISESDSNAGHDLDQSAQMWRAAAKAASTALKESTPKPVPKKRTIVPPSPKMKRFSHAKNKSSSYKLNSKKRNVKTLSNRSAKKKYLVVCK